MCQKALVSHPQPSESENSLIDMACLYELDGKGQSLSVPFLNHSSSSTPCCKTLKHRDSFGKEKLKK